MASLFSGLPSYKLMTTPVLTKSHKRQLPASYDSSSPVSGSVLALETRPARTPRCIGGWDDKREKCGNCKHIYLKTQSRCVGFCSVDCKSSALYMGKVSRALKAVRAVRQNLHETTDGELVVSAHIQSFSEFGADERTLVETSGEQKAFSAAY